MTQKAAVLGAGLVGATMARELARGGGFNVTAVDVSGANLKKLEGIPGVRTQKADLSNAQTIGRVASEHDVVLGALPSRFGFASLEAVIGAARPYCDISFMPEDAMALDALAKERGVLAVVDCGVSPGLSNLMIGHARSQMDRPDRAVIYVGGLPKVRHWPFWYKAPFAPSDVIEEYTRPARVRENGRTVVKPALSEPELLDFPGVGTLEAFNTDGLRSLLATLDIPNMVEKTLRYPGHVELMRAFRETGFFDKAPLDVGGVSVRPLDVTSKLLFPKWTYAEGEEEFTVLRVVVEGVKNGAGVRLTYDLHDEYDRATNESSMARTTAFPNVIAARMVARGDIRGTGVRPPELLARQSGVYEHFEDQLRLSGISIARSTSIVAEPGHQGGATKSS
ncbi:MAG: saccharopine dehydrogenase C-terminal domain-containing protein [Planctomycetota bacterium]